MRPHGLRLSHRTREDEMHGSHAAAESAAHYNIRYFTMAAPRGLLQLAGDAEPLSRIQCIFIITPGAISLE